MRNRALSGFDSLVTLQSQRSQQVTPSPSVIGTLTAGWSLVGVGDFNGDGTDDLLLRSSQTSEIDLWTMNGATVLSQGSAGGVMLRPTQGLIDGDRYLCPIF